MSRRTIGERSERLIRAWSRQRSRSRATPRVPDDGSHRDRYTRSRRARLRRIGMKAFRRFVDSANSNSTGASSAVRSTRPDRCRSSVRASLPFSCSYRPADLSEMAMLDPQRAPQQRQRSHRRAPALLQPNLSQSNAPRSPWTRRCRIEDFQRSSRPRPFLSASMSTAVSSPTTRSGRS